jgi:tRNA A37 threonylcarbamoyladenosine dehydratase
MPDPVTPCREQPCACDALHSEPRPSIRDNEAEETPYRLHRRFDRLGRMFGDEAVSALMKLRVAVFGLGGVGCYAAEALARSAVGHLVLVDFDDVCITNTNRQLQAMQGTIGKPKAWVLRDRLQLVNPQAKVHAHRMFYNQQRSEKLLTPPWPGAPQFDWVVDCIDNFTAKAHLIATCRARGIRVISSMGAAGKLDPTRIRTADLAEAHGCPMARELRKILRTRYGFPPHGPMGVRVVYSSEKRSWPRELAYDGGKGFRCACGKKSDEHSCDSRAIIDGTVAYVTGAFGFACASVVVNTTAVPLIERAPPAVSLKEAHEGRS